jgi:hypothetical protein
MLRIVVIFLVASLGWMVWWAFGQGAYEKGLATWVEARRAEGWAADYATLETRGFPNRFDTRITDVAFADPATGVAWAAPFIELLSLSYKPHQVIAVLPETHKFSTPFQTVEIGHTDARASLFLEPSTRLGLDRAVFVVSDLRARSSLGAQVALAQGRVAAEAVEGENRYRAGAEFTGLKPSAAARRALDPAGILPERVTSLRLDAMLDFTAPWDRLALEDARPQITRIKLNDLSARWGSVNFRAAGEVSVDAQGIPEGRITLRAEDWRRMLQMAEGMGWLPLGMRNTLESALGLLSGPGDVIDTPITFSGGAMRLGLIPLGPAPRLILR